GCASPRPAVVRPTSSFAQGLSLSMRLGKALVEGDRSVKADFTLTNNGSTAFDGCFAPSWWVSVILGRDYGAGHIVRPDRPRCDERFALRPGQRIAWSKTVPLGNLRGGAAKVTGWVKVVDPAACDQSHGCHETSVATPVMTVAIGGR